MMFFILSLNMTQIVKTNDGNNIIIIIKRTITRKIIKLVVFSNTTENEK